MWAAASNGYRSIRTTGLSDPSAVIWVTVYCRRSALNPSLTIRCDKVRMLQVWKIEVPSRCAAEPAAHGWALAQTANEAKELSGCENAVIKRKPGHLWIAPERVIWERQSTT